LTNVSFASFNAPYNPVHLMYEKKNSWHSIFITAPNNPVRLMVPKIR